MKRNETKRSEAKPGPRPAATAERCCPGPAPARRQPRDGSSGLPVSPRRWRPPPWCRPFRPSGGPCWRRLAAKGPACFKIKNYEEATPSPAGARTPQPTGVSSLRVGCLGCGSCCRVAPLRCQRQAAAC